jgi:chloramphenicol-sensitive protein RarD
VLAPLAAGYLGVLAARGTGTFAALGWPHALALASAGVVTATPLLLFGAAARRIPLSLLGLVQYLTPTIQFLLGVLVLHEPMPLARWVGFALVWLALAILTADGLRQVAAARALRAG